MRTAALLILLAAVPSSGQTVKEKEAIKSAEEALASTMKTQSNTDDSGGLNSSVCDALCKQTGTAKARPKSDWVYLTVSVDWPSFQGKTDDSHGIPFITERCRRVIMGLNELGQYGSGSKSDQAVYREAMRKQIKSIRCRFDPNGVADKGGHQWPKYEGKKSPVLTLKEGVLTAGFDFTEDAEENKYRTLTRVGLANHL